MPHEKPCQLRYGSCDNLGDSELSLTVNVTERDREMKIKTVSVTYGRKINLGDYNSATLEVTHWADLEQGEVPDKVATALMEAGRERVREEYLRMVQAQS